MMRVWVIYAVVGATLFAVMMTFSGCSESGIPTTRSTPNSEAESKAGEYLERTVTRCGDGEYTIARWGEKFYGNLVQQSALLELKNPSPVVKETPLTPADKLNGIEWRGTLDVSAAAHRQYDENVGRWSEWRDGVPQHPKVARSLIGLPDGEFYKKNGRWSIDNMNELFAERKPDCSKIPSMTGR